MRSFLITRHFSSGAPDTAALAGQRLAADAKPEPRPAMDAAARRELNAYISVRRRALA